MSAIAGWASAAIRRADLKAIARRHWLAGLVLAAGLALRVVSQIAYRPAIIYIDTMKYLYNAWPGADPVGYKLPLNALLLVGDLGTVAAVQHLVGLGIAVTMYVILVRRGVWRWLAALAIAPVLLDAYQVQIEQTIMPDVWFEALVVAAIAVLLLWPAGASGAPNLRAIAIAGVLFGAAATFRQVGEVLIAPALLYVVIAMLKARAGEIPTLSGVIAMFCGFALPVAGYATGSLLITGHFWLASTGPSISTYGRFAAAADCATLRVPAYERGLCPMKWQQAYGVDWLDHAGASPLKTWMQPPGMNRYAVIADFNQRVLAQQPQRVLAAIGSDASLLFSVARSTSEGGTPISRWQFQVSYKVYQGYTWIAPDGTLGFNLPPPSYPGKPVPHRLEAAYGGKPAVSYPLAVFLRDYQLGGGYVPGPLLALFTLTALAGSAVGVVRRQPPARRSAALGSLLFLSTGAAILLISDVFQYSWRYQLPALVTLPPAGALGIAAVAGYVLRRPAGEPAGDQRGEVAALASPAL